MIRILFYFFIYLDQEKRAQGSTAAGTDGETEQEVSDGKKSKGETMGDENDG